MNLEDLVIQAERLAGETGATDLPHVDRTLKQLLQATEELHSRVTESGSNNLAAHQLLGSKGVDLPKLIKKLDELSVPKSFEPVHPLVDTDIRESLKDERETAILNVIEETKADVYSTVEHRKWHCVYADWGMEKEALLNSMVGPNQQDFPEAQCHRVPTQLPDTPAPISRLNGLEHLYAKEICSDVQSLNQRPSLMVRFASLAFDDPVVREMWSVLRYMTKGVSLSPNSDPIQSRQTTMQFIKPARTLLERRYKNRMIEFTEKNLAIAKRGGIPNVYNLVRSYVSVSFQLHHSLAGMQDVVNGRPLWPLVYYSLRCGDPDAAVQFLKESGTCPDLLELMAQQLQQDSESSSKTIKRQLELEYKDRLRHCSDPYKKAVYAIVLACDPHELHPELMSKSDDFLWLKLSILQGQDRGDYCTEQLTYAGLQSLILEKYGENYFIDSPTEPRYFEILVLTGQFETAIEVLARTVSNRSHAVHMAIALNEKGLLGTPSCTHEPLLSCESTDPPPMKRLNMVRLIIMYTKCFEQSDTAQALHYYYQLRHFKTKEGHNAMVVCFCDLIVEKCDDQTLELLFGVEDRVNSHQFSSGVLDQFSSMDCDKYSLAAMAGDELSSRTNYEAAVKLYLIAGQVERAMCLVSSLLSQVIHQITRPGGLRERLGKVIRHLDSVLTDRNPTVKAHVMLTYKMLSQLMQFFDYYHAGKMRLASAVLNSNRLIPSNSLEADKCMSHLKIMGTEIMKVLPSVLLAAMEIVYAEYVDLKAADDDQTEYANREGVLRHLRGRAKALTYMAGCYPNLALDVSQRLVQLENRML
ncbi:hypothetical protein KR059_009652 [Drosophila kikkawai]|nr:hypothetical protein KR059_009652 [Drosophila kikkawai]